MKNYKLYQVDSFTKNLFQGNPAGVVPNADGLTETQMQAIAREMNNSETAFILSPTSSDHEVWVRFFTPTTEVPSCGHATIAAHYVRATEISRQIRCNGYFVFVLTDGSGGVLSHGRMFAPAIGIPEDPVTGNANGPLGAYLVQHRLVPNDGRRFAFKGQQGEAIGRLGTVVVTVEVAGGRPKTVHVGGRAVTVFKSEIAL